jgi:hypothetical protein
VAAWADDVVLPDGVVWVPRRWVVRAAGRVLAQGAQTITGARIPAEGGQIAAFRPIPPDLAAAVQAAVEAAFTAAR